MKISAYHVNEYGVLCYSGLPTEHNDLKSEHHNGIIYKKPMFSCNNGYEVKGVTEFGLTHGLPKRIFKYWFFVD